MSTCRRVYDHRLREMTCEEGDTHLFTGMGVPRSTFVSWLRRGPREVVTLDVVAQDTIDLQAEVLRLRRRCAMLLAITRLFALLVRLSGARLDETRLPIGADKEKVLKAVARARASIPLAVASRVLSLSTSRYSSWARPERACQLDDRSTCPRTMPTQLTPEEVRTMHEMVTAPDHRHMSVHGLALHAQRIGKLFASPGT